MDELLGPTPEHNPASPELCELVARAADLCLKPLRHAVRFNGDPPSQVGECSDCCVLIEARDSEGVRVPDADLELEIYRSGAALNLMLSRLGALQAPLLWHGSHPVWMEADSGLRCERPADGAALEALCRRLRVLLDDRAADSAGLNHRFEL